MPTPTKGARLGAGPSHERQLLANLASQLFEHGRITTTEAKAKKLRPYAERLITKAKYAAEAEGPIRPKLELANDRLKTARLAVKDKDNDSTQAALVAAQDEQRPLAQAMGTASHNRREIMKVIHDKDIVQRLIIEIGPFFSDRAGGYTRIVKTMPRKGDNAPMAVIELITEKTVTAEAEAARKTKFAEKPKKAEKTEEAPAAAEAPEAPHGPGSHAPLEDGSQPEGFPIKGNADSMLYHVPDSAFYDRTVAEVWFATAEDAEKAGFALPKSQREDESAEDES